GGRQPAPSTQRCAGLRSQCCAERLCAVCAPPARKIVLAQQNAPHYRERHPWCGAFVRGAGQIRTADFLRAKQALSQLSYSPSCALYQRATTRSTTSLPSCLLCPCALAG